LCKVSSAPAKDSGKPQNFNLRFRRLFDGLLVLYSRWLGKALTRPGLTVLVLVAVFAACFVALPGLVWLTSRGPIPASL